MTANQGTCGGANLFGSLPHETDCHFLRAGFVTAALILFGTLGPVMSGDDRADDQKKAKPGTVKEPALRQELLKRMGEDQNARSRLTKVTAGKDTTAPATRKQSASTAQEMWEVDAHNRAWMKEIVDHYGWPGRSLVGKDGSEAAWLLVQHADPDRAFQKRCLVLLAGAVKKKDASPQDLAYLTDRVRVGDKAKQVYGTQFRQVNGKWEPLPIEDEANVDKRRKEVGLPPMAEYRKMMEAAYQPQGKKSGK